MNTLSILNNKTYIQLNEVNSPALLKYTSHIYVSGIHNHWMYFAIDRYYLENVLSLKTWLTDNPDCWTYATITPYENDQGQKGTILKPNERGLCIAIGVSLSTLTPNIAKRIIESGVGGVTDTGWGTNNIHVVNSWWGIKNEPTAQIILHKKHLPHATAFTYMETGFPRYYISETNINHHPVDTKKTNLFTKLFKR